MHTWTLEIVNGIFTIYLTSLKGRVVLLYFMFPGTLHVGDYMYGRLSVYFDLGPGRQGSHEVKSVRQGMVT